MTKVARSRLATETVASLTHNEKANDIQKATAIKMTKPSAGTLTDTSMLPRLRSSLQLMVKDYDGFNFSSSLGPKQLYLLAVRYNISPE